MIGGIIIIGASIGFAIYCKKKRNHIVNKNEPNTLTNLKFNN